MMRYWRIDIGGVTYWVAAPDEKRAIALATETPEHGLGDERDVAIRELNAEDLAERIHTDNGDESEPISQFLAREYSNEREEVFACSEWV